MNINRISGPMPKSLWSEIYPYVYGLAVILSIILVFTLISAVIFYFSDFNESYFRPLGILISALALFCGGFAMSRKSLSHGLIGGLILGVVFMVILTVITLLTNGNLSNLLDKLVYLILASTIGGICGIK